MKEGKRRRRWSCGSGSLWLGVLRSYAGTLIFQQGSIGFGIYVSGLIELLLILDFGAEKRWNSLSAL